LHYVNLAVRSKKFIYILSALIDVAVLTLHAVFGVWRALACMDIYLQLGE